MDGFPSGGRHGRHGKSFQVAGLSPVRNLVPPIFLDEPGGIGDDDLVASGPDHAILLQLTQDPYHDLPSRPHGLRQLPLADPDHKLRSRVVVRCRFGQTLGCQVEQMGHALTDRGERAAGDLPDEGQHPFAQLTEKRYGDSHIALRAIVGDILSSSTSTSAWVGAGIAYGAANSDGAPMRAPGRQ